AIEPVIGHLKEHHRMGRNYLAHASGDAINAVLAAAGYNFRRLLAWLRLLLLRILIALSLAAQLKLALNRVLHGRLKNLAQRYSVGITAIESIKRGKTWNT